MNCQNTLCCATVFAATLIDTGVSMQAQHWSCLRGLVPADPPTSLVRLEHRQIPQVKLVSGVISDSLQQHSVRQPQDMPSQVVMTNSDSQMHDGAAAGVLSSSEQQSRKSGQAKAWPQSAKDMYMAGGRQADAVVGSERTPVHADSQLNAPVGPVTDSAAVHDHSSMNKQSTALPARGSIVPSSKASAGAGVQAGVPVSTAHVQHDEHHAEHVASSAAAPSKVHESVADNSSKHGDRLLAEGQETHSHAAKAAHRSKHPVQMCQGKSHQRLLLMTALHVSAHKQMKRQHKSAHAGAHETATKRSS